jgi:hypothetical protein
MTLNLIALTDATIYLAADFQLSSTTGAALPIDRSYKVVTVTYPRWAGFLTYTGVGMVAPATPVHQLLSEWIRGPEDPSMLDVAKTVQAKGSRWLQALFRRLQPIPHTFILAGFADGRPRAYVISNFERWEGQVRLPGTRLDLTSVTVSRGDVKLIVTGQKRAVSRSDRERLRRAIREHQQRPAQVRQLLSEANASAAQHPSARGFISCDCYVFSFDIQGRGQGQGGEDVSMAPQIVDGRDMVADITDLLGVRV